MDRLRELMTGMTGAKVGSEVAPGGHEGRLLAVSRLAGKVASVAIFVALLLSTTLAFADPPGTGHWEYLGVSDASTTGGSWKRYRFVDDETGEVVSLEGILDGESLAQGESIATMERFEGADSYQYLLVPVTAAAPRYVPTGYSGLTEPTQADLEDQVNVMPVSEDRLRHEWGDIAILDPDHVPTFNVLNPEELTMFLERCAVEYLVMPMCQHFFGFGRDALDSIDVTRLFDGRFAYAEVDAAASASSAGEFGDVNVAASEPEDLTGRGWATFYNVARRVNDKIAVPYGGAVVVCGFVVAMVRLADERRLAQPGWFERLAWTFALYALAFTLVVHALDVMEFLYWLGQNLVKGVSAVTGQSGLMSQGLGDQLQDVFDGQWALITYDQFTSALLYFVLCIVLSIACVMTSVRVYVIAFLRIAEIYLRAAFSAIPLATVVDEEWRRVAVDYCKRFLAVCFSAAAIVVALALAPAMLDVATSIFRESAVADGGAGLYLMLPTLAALFAINQVVTVSQQVANGLFGLQ